MTPLGEGIEAWAALIPPSSASAAVAPSTAFDFVEKLRELNFEPFDMLAFASLPEWWATRKSQADGLKLS
jgi:hypothetical protein